MKTKHVHIIFVVSICFVFVTNAQNSAPSSHFQFNFAGSNKCEVLLTEIRVPTSGFTLNTYYESLGWGGSAAGYCGIQCHPSSNGKTPYIFSIWDNTA